MSGRTLLSQTLRRQKFSLVSILVSPALRRQFASASSSSSPPSSARAIMPIEESMRDKLEREFLPSVLNIRNDSSKHAHHAAMVAQGGGSGETHFFVEIVSSAFEGKNQLWRHRAVNNLMAPEFDQGLHALSLRTKTPAEWIKEQQWANAASAPK